MQLNSPQARAARARAMVVALMVALSLTSYFHRTIMGIGGGAIMKEFSIDETSMGATYTAFLLPYAFLNLPGGFLADRLGTRLVLTLMGLGSGLFIALNALAGVSALASSLGVVVILVLVRAGLGVFTAPLYPSLARANASWVPAARQARVQGWIAAGAGIGGATSPLIFPWMVRELGWRLSFVLAGAATILLALIWARFFRNRPAEHRWVAGGLPLEGTIAGGGLPPRAAAAPGSTPWRSLLRSRHLLVLTLSYLLLCYFDYIFFFWIYYYLNDVRGFREGESGIATTAIFLAWTLLSPLGGWLYDRLAGRLGPRAGRRLVPVVCMGLAAACLCLGINLSDKVATAFMLALSFGFAGAADAPYWAAAIQLGGRHVGAACGILNTGGNLGGVAPYLTPLVATGLGWDSGLYVAAVGLVVASILWFSIDPSATVSGDSR